MPKTFFYAKKIRQELNRTCRIQTCALIELTFNLKGKYSIGLGFGEAEFMGMVMV